MYGVCTSGSVDPSNAHTVAVTDDLLEAGWLELSVNTLLTHLLLDRLADVFLPHYGGLLAHHLVLVVALLKQCRLAVQLYPVRHFVI